MKNYKLFFREIFYFLKSFFIIKKSNLHKKFIKEGYLVVENFIEQNYVDELKNNLDKELINNKNKIIKDDIESDFRIYGINHINYEFDSIINSKVNYFIKKNFGYSFPNSFLMANKLVYKKNNLGSGQGWHRDSEPTDQFKCLIYLDDVFENHGPFEYIKKSHSPINFISLFFNKKIKYYQYRFNQNEINKIISNKLKCITFEAKKGTAIFFNSRGIHRGKPISSGTRYACTSYYFDQNIPKHLQSILNE